jgi:hypothetical protein
MMTYQVVPVSTYTMSDKHIGTVFIPDETVTYMTVRRIPRIMIDAQVITGAIISGFNKQIGTTQPTTK